MVKSMSARLGLRLDSPALSWSPSLHFSPSFFELEQQERQHQVKRGGRTTPTKRGRNSPEHQISPWDSLAEEGDGDSPAWGPSYQLPSSLTVLVADDERINRQMLSRKITKMRPFQVCISQLLTGY